MVLFIDFLQAFLHDVRINLRRRNIRMAEHKLNRTQIRAPLQQVSRKTMTQHVRFQFQSQRCFSPVLRKLFPETDAAHAAPEAIQENVWRQLSSQKTLAGLTQILLNRSDGASAHGNHSFLVSLADASQTARLQLQITETKIHQFGYAEPR